MLGALLLLAACAPPGDAPRTYGEHVAPILTRRCARCHGGPGRAAVVPPRLASYEDAKWSAGAIALAVQRGRMPPWGPDNTGSCGTWSDALWLSEEEVNTLSDWTASGAPRGPAPRASPPEDPVELPPPGSRWIAVGPLEFEPGLGSDTTRCFVIPLDLSEDVRVTALRVVGSGAVSVQQAALHALDGRRRCGLRHVATPRRQDPAGRAAGAAVSRDPVWWPVGRGSRPCCACRRGPASGSLRADRSSSSCSTTSSPPGSGPKCGPAPRSRSARPHGKLSWSRCAPSRCGLPPGQRQAEASAERVVSRRLAVAGVLPRMHTLGRVMDLVWRRGEERMCVAHFGHWDPSLQQLFVREHAVELEPGDRLQLSCTYDSTSRTEWVEQGEEIEREQCAAFLYFLPRP